MEHGAPDSPDVAALLPAPWVVHETFRETPDVVTLVLKPGDGVAPMAFAPGQFNMLYAFGIGEVPISISGDHAAGSPLVHTIRDVGMVSHALCESEVGDLIGVRGPFGSHWPIEEARGRDIVVAAGGIGLAPLRPVIRHVLNHRDDYRNVALLYGSRTPEDLLFTREHDTWRQRDLQVEVTVNTADPSWRGHIGVVTTLIRRAHFDASGATAFVCGPEVMMRFTAAELRDHGVATDATYVSMERNMKCAVGFCGHCQLGPELVCLDGPVFPWQRMQDLITVREL